MCPRQESNLRPTVPETGALSSELRGRRGASPRTITGYQRARTGLRARRPVGAVTRGQEPPAPEDPTLWRRRALKTHEHSNCSCPRSVRCGIVPCPPGWLRGVPRVDSDRRCRDHRPRLCRWWRRRNPAGTTVRRTRPGCVRKATRSGGGRIGRLGDVRGGLRPGVLHARRWIRVLRWHDVRHSLLRGRGHRRRDRVGAWRPQGGRPDQRVDRRVCASPMPVQCEVQAVTAAS